MACKAHTSLISRHISHFAPCSSCPGHLPVLRHAALIPALALAVASPDTPFSSIYLAPPVRSLLRCYHLRDLLLSPLVTLYHTTLFYYHHSMWHCEKSFICLHVCPLLQNLCPSLELFVHLLCYISSGLACRRCSINIYFLDWYVSYLLRTISSPF